VLNRERRIGSGRSNNECEHDDDHDDQDDQDDHDDHDDDDDDDDNNNEIIVRREEI
jgi:hypothetical protein